MFQDQLGLHMQPQNQPQSQNSEPTEQILVNVPVKKKRKKVGNACIYCRRSHMTCDEGRPCQRCIKRDIGHLCRDEAKPAQAGTAPSASASTTTTSAIPSAAKPLPPQQQTTMQPSSLGGFGPYATSNSQPPPSQSQLPGGSVARLQSPVAPLSATSAQPWTPLAPGPPGHLASGPGPSTSGWASEAAGNEFSALSEFLETLDERSYFGHGSTPVSAHPSHGAGAHMEAEPLHTQTPANGFNHQAFPPNTHQQPIHPPNPNREPGYILSSAAAAAAANKTEQFLMTAADQPGGTRDERLAQVIHAKYEAGLLKPYNYVNGYRRLSTWMERHVSPNSRQAIQQPLAMLRPRFRAVAQNLTDLDLIFIEEAFERLLLDYDRVFSAMAVPACLWRRTGEIYKGNREFANMIGVNVNDLLEGKLAIYELMSEESAVNFWEKYGHVAFDTGQKAVLTSCVLRYKPREVVAPHLVQPGGPQMQEGYVNCCFSFTIRRDSWGIPVAIVGNFISY